MGRRVAELLAGASIALLAGCGGGGGGGGGSGGIPTLPNQVCDSTNRICISADRLIILVGDTTAFTASVKNASGGPQQGVQVVVTDGMSIQFEGPDSGMTDQDGLFPGTIRGALGGSALLTATAPGLLDSDGNALKASVRMSVQGAGPTPTTGVSPTPGGPGTPTPTPGSIAAVTTIFMETEPFTVSSQNGDTVDIYAVAFDQDNRPLNGVNLLFDFAPKVGQLREIATTTRRGPLPGGTVQDGVAHVQITIPPGVAAPGPITVTATAGEVQGQVVFTITPGAATVKIETVLLQISDATCGTDVGGGLTLRAVVFDADNKPIDEVNVLFVTPVGEVLPLTAVTRLNDGQAGVAQTTLQIPAGAPVLVDDSGNILPHIIRARAGGVEGTVQLFIVPGREECLAGGNGNQTEGEAASVTMSASPNRVRVRGSGSREISSIVATVFDNTGARLSNAEVRFALSPLTRAEGALLLPANLTGGYCSAPRGRACATADQCDPGATCDVDVRNRFVSYTDRAGNGQIQLRSGTGLGTVTALAEIPSELGDAFTQPCSDPRTPGERCIISNGLDVTVTAGLPGRLSVVVNQRSIDNNDGTELTTITAIVTDADGNTVENGTPVSFTVVPFTPDDDVSRRIGIVGFPVTNSLPPCDVSQYEQQTGIPVVAQPGNATTCLTFPSAQAGTDVQVQVESGNITSLRTITLPGAVGDLVAVANPSTVVVTESEPGRSVITAVVRDDDGNPVRNAKITFETPVGAFRTQEPQFFTTALTDANGVASATLTIPTGTPPGDINVLVFGGGIGRLGAAELPIAIKSSGTTPGAGQPQSIVLESATPTTIGVKSSGRPDQSIVAVSVRDRLNTALANVPVTFLVNAVGGVQITPTTTVTDEQGIARTTVLAGTLATAVQITATVDVNDDGVFEIVNQFTPVNIVGGVPNAARFSLAAQFVNIAGRVSSGLEDEITAFVNDHFGNAATPQTAINFTTNGASVFAQRLTDEAGRATTTLISEGGVPENGIVTVLATTRGEEPFIDGNGNGVHDADEPFTDVPEPFIDFDANGRFDRPEPFTDTNDNGRWDEGEPFTDTNGNTRYDANANERFIDVNDNDEWDAAQTPGVWVGNALISASTDVTFSAHTQALFAPPTFAIPDGGSQQFTLVVADRDLNPLTGGSTIGVALVGEGAEIVGIPSSFTLPDAESFGALVPGLNSFTFFVVDAQPGQPTAPTNLAVNVTITSEGAGAPGGNGSVFVSSIGQLLPAPTGTPLPTPTETLAPTVTSTPTVSPMAANTATATPVDTASATATASVTGTPPATGTVTATTTPTLPAASVQFVSALPTAIGVRASGLAEQSVLTFRVTDVTANPVRGQPVTFTLTALGGESVNPTMATTDGNGQVTTTLTSGTRTTSVQVIARVDANGDGTPDFSTQSTAVAIFGAPPAQPRFSIAPELRNIAGRVSFGITDGVSAFVNDRFGNAVPPTSVSFLPNGASVVVPSMTTSSGVATATLISEGLVIPPTGIITILAWTVGEEGFLDNNGNGRFDAGTDTITTDNQPEPFIDFRPLPLLDGGCPLPAPSPFCNFAFDPFTPFEHFIDAGPLNETWGAQGTSGVWDDDVLVWDSTTVTFSGPLVSPVATADDGQPVDNFMIPDGGSLSFTLEVHDDLVNPLVGGSTISVQANVGQVIGGSITIPDGQSFNQLLDGLTRFHFTLLDSAPGEGMAAQLVNVTVTVTSQNGNLSIIIADGVILPPPATPTPGP